MTPIDELQRLAHQFRLGLSLEATQELPNRLQQLMDAYANRPELAQPLSRIMSALLGCQEREDWLGLADWLEYELASLLNQPSSQAGTK